MNALAGSRRPDHGSFLATRTFGSLDGLRAVAILMVLWHHTVTALPGWRLTERGFLGVDLFFEISGFLIVTLLLRERRRTGTISLRDFYVRRFLRIMPPFYLMLLVVGGKAFLEPGTTSADVMHDLPFAFFYVSNLVPMRSMLSITWSLSVEEQFYVLVPALEKQVRRSLPAFLVAAYVLAVIPTFGVFPEVELPTFFRETTFGPILLGVLLAHVLDDPRGFGVVARLLGSRWASALALLGVLVVGSHPAADISGAPRILMHFAMLALLASCVVMEDHALARVLGALPLRRIGITSYGIYLYHLIVMHFVAAAFRKLGLAQGTGFFLATTAAAWAVAEASYRFYETRFLALKARFVPRAPTMASTTG